MRERSSQDVPSQGPAKVVSLVDRAGVRPAARPSLFSRAGARIVSLFSADGARREPLAARHVGSAAPEPIRDEARGGLAVRHLSDADELARLFSRAMGGKLNLTVLTAYRAQFNFWRSQGWGEPEIVAATSHIFFGVETGQQSVPACGDCGHSPHHADEAMGLFCTAVKEMDDGPHLCGCDVDDLSGGRG